MPSCGRSLTLSDLHLCCRLREYFRRMGRTEIHPEPVLFGYSFSCCGHFNSCSWWTTCSLSICSRPEYLTSPLAAAHVTLCSNLSDHLCPDHISVALSENSQLRGVDEQRGHGQTVRQTIESPLPFLNDTFTSCPPPTRFLQYSQRPYQ